MCEGPHDFIPATGVARLELIYTANGQRVENVVYVRREGHWEAANLIALAESAATEWDVSIGGHTSTGVTLELVRATDVSEDEGRGVEIPPAAPTSGDVGGQIMPNNVTVATKFATGFTGRSRRGRAYFVGLAESQVDGNILATGVDDAITEGWQLFFAGLTDGSAPVEHVIVSYCGDGAWRPEAVVTPVISYSTEAYIDSQRRRLTGRGN